VTNVCVTSNTTSGGGTPTGTGDGISQTACCASNKIPSALVTTWTFTGPPTQTFNTTATYNIATGNWEATVTSGGQQYVLTLRCNAGTWTAWIACNGGFNVQFLTGTGTTCNPFSSNWSFTTGNCATGSGTVTFAAAAGLNSGGGGGNIAGTYITVTVEKSTMCLPPPSAVGCTDNTDCCGQSTFGNGPPVAITCCSPPADFLMPLKLFGVFSNKTGTCTCLPDSFELVNTHCNAGEHWTSSLILCGAPRIPVARQNVTPNCPPYTCVSITLDCLFTQLNLGVSNNEADDCAPSNSPLTHNVQACPTSWNPFVISFTGVTLTLVCDPAGIAVGTADVTIFA
jgi:hypothetical protein